jgi:predicted phage baseplate assembly protein
VKTALPYVDRVVNWREASGGSEEESSEALLQRGPRILRHRSRAVTREDFEDLAILASPEVARSKSVPLFDLRNDPDSLFSRPGVVSVIVVPRSASSRPVPSAELLDRVRSFLNACRPAAVAADDKLVILGPEYVPIDMRLEITVTDPEIANEVELAVTLALQRFLHPLTGGPKGTGWDFGRLPQKSDIFSLIERVTGVSHVRKLQLRARFEREGIDKTAHFLVCCGQQQVVATLEE